MKGHIYVIGMGPGKRAGMTAEAAEAVNACDVIVGYTVYVELIRTSWPEKVFFTTPMRQEIARCRKCYELAEAGKTVGLVCSGDAGIYGMAAPMLELQREYPEAEVTVIPGTTAANSGAAVLGAPLNHDFCVISLSDLLTPWAVIERRIRCGVQGDFVMVIYNPSSRKRADYLRKAADIMLAAGAEPNRACGYVENIGREGTRAVTCTLAELREAKVNMFTTVYVGNSRSFIRGGKLITPRGYEL